MPGASAKSTPHDTGPFAMRRLMLNPSRGRGEQWQAHDMTTTSLAGDVLVTFPGYDPAGERTGRVLAGAGLSIRLAPKTGQRSPDELLDLLADAVGAIVSTDPFQRGVLEASPKLRVIARVRV